MESRKRVLTTADLELLQEETAVPVSEEELFEEFVSIKRAENVSESTVDTYYQAQHVINRDLPFAKIAQRNLSQLSTKDWQKLILYWKDSGIAIPTINGRIKVMKTYYNTLMDSQSIAHNPIEKIITTRQTGGLFWGYKPLLLASV